MILFNSIILKRNLFLLTINNGRIFNQIFSPIFQILIKLIDNYSNRYKRIIIAQAIRIAKYLRIPKCRISKAESGKQIPTSSLANTRHLYSQTPTWTPRFSLMRDMDTNWGGEGRGRERIVEKQEMPRKVSLQIIVLSSSRYSTLSLSLWKSFFFLLPRLLPRQSFPRYVPHFSPPVKIHFPEHDTFEDAARAAHYPLPLLFIHPLSSLLSIRFEIVKFHRFTNYRSRSPLLRSKVVSVSIRVSLIFFLRSNTLEGYVF